MKEAFYVQTSNFNEWQGFKCIFFITFSEKIYIHDFPLKTKKWLIKLISEGDSLNYWLVFNSPRNGNTTGIFNNFLNGGVKTWIGGPELFLCNVAQPMNEKN